MTKPLPPPDSPGGEKLDRFELIAELASGGMATVFLARLPGVAGFQRLYAIKRLHPHLAKDGEFIQMFLDEARLAARIHHPNVVPIHEIGTTAAGYYLVMEYIEGDTLARLFQKASLAGHKIPPGIGVRIALDALAGLHAAHELKDDEGKSLELVHRDVSPQNILVGSDGTARITDFGVARASSRLSTTRAGQLKGKLSYMAPEQARTAPIDRRADVFAMGIVLFETLAQRRLFKGDGDAETLNKLLYEAIPRLKTLAPDVPAELDEVVMRALDRDVDKRYATAQEMADALEKAATALGIVVTTRDVAACVEKLVGAEVSQQRAAVRAWTTSSEPSAPSRRPPEGAESATKVEAGKATHGSGVPPSVSSVSSAALHVPSVPPPLREETGPSVSKQKRARGWAVALGAAIVLIAWAGFAFRHGPKAPPPRDLDETAAAAAPPALTTMPAPSAALAPSEVASADATPPPAETPSVAPSASSRPSKHVRPHPRPQGSAAEPVEPAKPDAPAVPDDITRNPYR